MKRSRTRAARLVAVIAAGLLGATAAASVTGAAASRAITPSAEPSKPTPTSQPRISGNVTEGGRVSTDGGTWIGTPPISYAFQWQRCNENGGGCAGIGGATHRAYIVQPADVAHRLRVRVTATNAQGSISFRSDASPIVASRPVATTTAPPAPTGPAGLIDLGNGVFSIPVTSVSPPDRLVIDQVSFSPNPLRSRSSALVGRFRVTDVTKGYRVRGALVYAIGLPYGWLQNSPEVATDTDGFATLQLAAGRTLPAHGSIVVFLRARKPGDDLLAGVSTRRLVQTSVSIG